MSDRIACSMCGRTLNPERVESGEQPKVAMIQAGALLPLQCGDCDTIICHECQSGGGTEGVFNIELTCKICDGELAVMTLPADDGEDSDDAGSTLMEFDDDSDDDASAIPPGWSWHDNHDGVFSLALPPHLEQVDAVSDGAALSCQSEDREILFEVFGFEWSGPVDDTGRDLPTVLADGIQETMYEEPGWRDARVIDRREIAFGDADTCIRLVVGYEDHGTDSVTDYCILGTGNVAVQLAIKTLPWRYEFEVEEFERILESLETPWLINYYIAPDADAPNDGAGDENDELDGFDDDDDDDDDDDEIERLIASTEQLDDRHARSYARPKRGGFAAFDKAANRTGKGGTEGATPVAWDDIGPDEDRRKELKEQAKEIQRERDLENPFYQTPIHSQPEWRSDSSDWVDDLIEREYDTYVRNAPVRKRRWVRGLAWVVVAGLLGYVGYLWSEDRINTGVVAEPAANAWQAVGGAVSNTWQSINGLFDQRDIRAPIQNYITLKRSNVRRAPTTLSQVLATLEPGTKVEILEVTENGQWLFIAVDGKEIGFIFAPLVGRR